MEYKNTVDLRLGNFRITNKCRFSSGTLDFKEGLALEKCIDDDGHYCVVAFIDWDEDAVEYKSVGTRLTTLVDASEWGIVKDLLEAGAKLVEVANSVDED